MLVSNNVIIYELEVHGRAKKTPLETMRIFYELALEGSKIKKCRLYLDGIKEMPISKIEKKTSKIEWLRVV